MRNKAVFHLILLIADGSKAPPCEGGAFLWLVTHAEEVVGLVGVV